MSRSGVFSSLSHSLLLGQISTYYNLFQEHYRLNGESKLEYCTVFNLSNSEALQFAMFLLKSTGTRHTNRCLPQSSHCIQPSNDHLAPSHPPIYLHTFPLQFSLKFSPPMLSSPHNPKRLLSLTLFPCSLLATPLLAVSPSPPAPIIPPECAESAYSRPALTHDPMATNNHLGMRDAFHAAFADLQYWGENSEPSRLS